MRRPSPAREAIFRDNMLVNVSAVMYFRESIVETKQVVLTDSMMRAIAKHAEAERERRAKYSRRRRLRRRLDPAVSV
jgi:hypothetical protein